jgi:hypothetical protein
MSNYPAGAANDPDAPYNEPDWAEIEVTATATLVKETVVLGSGTHTCAECEIEPDGSRSYVSFEESDDDPAELFRNQCKTPAEIFRDCGKVIKELKQLIIQKKVEGVSSLVLAHVSLNGLLEEMDGWEETEVKIE